ncbi:hypothetical protein ABMB67_000984 [Halalkalibacter oceani]
MLTSPPYVLLILTVGVLVFICIALIIWGRKQYKSK